MTTATTAQDHHEQRRIAVVRVLSLVAFCIGVVSLPFDWLAAPRWMLVEDALGIAASLGLHLLARSRHWQAARGGIVLLYNTMTAWNVLQMPLAEGSNLLFFPMAIVPFTLFDRNTERGRLWASALLPLVLFFVLPGLHGRYELAPYYVYSALIAFGVLVWVTARATFAAGRAEDALRQSQAGAIHAAKMAALGEMAAGIAHEINSPLTAIAMQAARVRQVVERQPGAPDCEMEVRQVASRIEQTVDRISKVVRSLRAFARDVADDPFEVVSARAVVEATLELCRERFKAGGVELRLALGGEDPAAEPKIRCRPVQLEQALLNLVNNAFDAVRPLEERWIDLRIAVAPNGRELAITVTDSGRGIPAPLRNRIMQPFFTTKQVGQGTGLGLALARGIAETHGGRLEIDTSCPNTRFVLTVPTA